MTLELPPGSVATEGVLIEQARARPYAGARGDPAARLGGAGGGQAARRPCHRAASSRRLAARHRRPARRRDPARTLGGALRYPRCRRPFPRRRARHAEGGGGRRRDRRFSKPTRRSTRRWRWPPKIRSPRGSPHRCRPTAAASGFATTPRPASPKSAEHHVALIRSILEGDEKAAAAEAERLMALLALACRGSGADTVGLGGVTPIWLPRQAPSPSAATLISKPSPAESTQLLPSVPVARIVQLPFSETKISITASAVDHADGGRVFLEFVGERFHHFCAVRAKLLAGEGVAVIVSRPPISAGSSTISRFISTSPVQATFRFPERLPRMRIRLQRSSDPAFGVPSRSVTTMPGM